MIRDASCVHSLLETLNTNDVQLHEATLRALTEINNDQCTSSLISYLEKDIHNKPIEALIEALASHQVWQVSEKIRPYLQSNSERVASSAAAFFYGCTGEKIYLDRVVGLLDHENRFVRQSAAFDLARLGTISATKPVLSANIPNNVKMYAIKAILTKSIQKPTHHEIENEAQNEGLRDSLFATLDSLTRENFSGNLLVNQSRANHPEPNSQINPSIKKLSNAFEKLKSPSLPEREEGIRQLIKNAKYADEDLLNSYFDELDQDIKMGVIKAMSELKNAAYVPAFVDAIGAEIGNHCQGNIRRVAACALGDINWSHQFESRAFSISMEKLGWTLQYPDDWGLRYSACIALEGIGNSKAQSLLVESKTKEVDQVVSARIDIALSTICNTDVS